MIDEKQIYKLFLSVDISGFTDIKNIVNLNGLNDRIKDRKIFLQNTVTESNIPEDTSTVLLNDAPYYNIPQYEKDWIFILQNTFLDLYAEFFDSLISSGIIKERENEFISLWKTLGDEMIFVCNISHFEQIHSIVKAFSLALIKIDNKLKRTIRLKGTVWGAEFPVRNRIIQIPKLEKTDEFLEEYVGPDMDIGFRLGKETCPSLITASLDIVYLLSRMKTEEQMRCCFVEFKKLKGVWGGNEYPIFWLRPSKPAIEEIISYEEVPDMIPYAKQELKFKKARKYKEIIKKILKQLPEELGIVQPYIPYTDDPPSLQSDLFNLYKNAIDPEINSKTQDDENQKGTIKPDKEIEEVTKILDERNIK